MKRTLKKHLLLTLAVAALMALFTFGSYAECETCVIDDTKDIIVYPTCTTGGYTEKYCGFCGNLVAKEDLTEPTGHLFDANNYYYESQAGDAYYFYKCVCSNENCNEVTYKTNENTGEQIKYYTVTFYNPWVTDTYAQDVTYAKLAQTYKTTELGTIYVAEGETAIYSGVLPVREKDKHERAIEGSDYPLMGYGSYVFSGWNKEAPKTGDIDASADADALKNITEKTEVYATFQGVPKKYVVTFVNGDNAQISSHIEVTHGLHDPLILTLFENNPPTKSDDSHYKYEFTGWDRDLNYFYDTCTVRPVFDTIEKEYIYVYHDSTGKEFYRTTLTRSSTAPTFTDEQRVRYINKADDKKYIYQWTGEWCWENTGTIVTVPYFIPGAVKEGEEIHLYPVYNKKLINYELQVKVRFLEENPFYTLEEFIVQVRDANGQLIGSGMTDENGVFTCFINYSSPVFITVMSEDTRCSGDASVSILYKDYPTVVDIPIDAKASADNPLYDCHCVCHNSLIKPIWVRILNILYKLFNIKYVCCDDMYASLGELLVYTQ